MRDVRHLKLAATQFNRVSRTQLLALGYSDRTIDRWISAGQFVAQEEGVYAVAPLLMHDEWGTWMGAALTAPESFLSHLSAGAAHGFWGLDRDFETVTRRGSGGPPRLGGGLGLGRATPPGGVG